MLKALYKCECTLNMLVINTGKELIKLGLFEDKKENRQIYETRQRFSTLFHLSEELYLEGKLKLHSGLSPTRFL